MNRQNVIGNKYGKLLVVSDAEDRGYTRYVNCVCDCGVAKSVQLIKVKSGHTQSCGCLHKKVVSKREVILVGSVYNRYTIKEEVVTDKKDRYVRCVCECGIEKLVSFPKLKSGHTKSCGCYSKDIVSKRIKEYNKNRPKKIKTQEEIDEQKERYRINKKMYCREHKERIKQYKKDNKERILEYAKAFQKERMKDPKYVILKRLRGRIYMALKKNSKSASTNKLLGCDLDFFKDYLEKKFSDGMSWDNMGKWHIDHIKPCALFDLTKTEQQFECFHYSNTQPLWEIDNLIKGTKYEQ